MTEDLPAPRHPRVRGGRLQGGRAARALLAARAVAAEHGVRSTEPRVLQDGVNVVVHLAPAPVVARVATLTPLLRTSPLRSFAREVAVAGALAAAGAPVVAPSALLPPGPHRYAGLELSFWQHVEVLPVAPSPGDTAGALVELHGYLTALPVDGAPLDTPLDDLARFVSLGGAWGASPAQLDRLRGTTRLDGRVALDAFPGAPTDAELAPWLELRWLHTAAWSLVAATGHPHLRASAEERLAAALG